ncbi:MAG TPA: cyclic pyranopterin monophosphate synthase MoaC [Phycisphaerae bacterium]
MNDSGAPAFSHLGPRGEVRMVDVSEKTATRRVATASACITIASQVLDAIVSGGSAGASPSLASPSLASPSTSTSLIKGDALAAARIAGIQAAKRTAELIPLCHPLPLDAIRIHFARQSPQTLLIVGTARATAPTGVEMEALTAVSVAALTIYDMVKSADRGMVIGPIRLEHKTGGRSGEYRPPHP